MNIALVGNQNSGKTTLFNLLTGSNQKVGNWPGVTIEQKTGVIKDTNYDLIDLPGIYSLSPYTPEEYVSRSYIFENKPDLIINIIDATSLERSLYLTTMLLELDCDVVIALNMADMLSKKGITIDIEKLSKELGTSIIEISALKRTGINELIDCVKNKTYLPNKHKKIFSEDIESAVKTVLTHIHMPHERFSAVKMLENDPKIAEAHIREIEGLREQIEKDHDMDIEQIIADERYQYITRLKNKVCTYIEVPESKTKKFDKILLNKWLAIPIFILVMAFIYFLAIYVGGLLSNLIAIGINGNDSFVGFGGWLGEKMSEGGASLWSISLVKDGIIKGVGSVLTFVPQILILFFCISILETIGYMSRIAYFFDKIFHKFGLSGKSLIPFVVGSGCSVPGIMTSRIVEDDNEKKMTIALTPLIPCSAKLPIITLFAGFIVGQNNSSLSFLVAFLTYIVAIILILIYSLLIKHTVLKGDSTSFLSELPEYKLPSMKYVGRDVLEKTLEFIKRAGTIILVSSIIVWWLSHYSWNMKFLTGNEIANSMLADIGKAFGWFFYPMCGGQYSENNWALAVSALQGLIAKEQVVSSMSVIGEQYFIVFRKFPVVAVAFMAFVLYSIPCIATVSVTKKETGSLRKTLGICAFQLLSAWILSSLIGSIGVGIAYL